MVLVMVGHCHCYLFVALVRNDLMNTERDAEMESQSVSLRERVGSLVK
jgi:hypothetical protein